MILAVNIGNTNISAGFWRDGGLRQASTPTAGLANSEQFQRFLEDRIREAGDQPGDIRGSVMASVVPGKTSLVSGAIEALTGTPPRLVETGPNIGIDLSAYDSSLLGIDRVVCCVSALAKYPPPLVVFDLGTATTVNVVDAAGAFLGGAILPGVRMGLEALSDGTSLLPRLRLDANIPLIGHNTRECLMAGAVFGAVCAIEGFTQRVREELRQTVTVVVTGGNAGAVVPHCKIELHHEPSLLLDGLVRIFINKQKGR